MKLLAIETCTEACSAAISTGDDVLERYQLAPQRHAELILPMVEDLLAEAGVSLRDLDALAFGRGPGSFTGVRICTGVVQGLAFGAELPVIPVSTLAALAQGAAGHHSHIAAAIDARMGEVYWGLFSVDPEGLVVPADEEQVEKPELVPLPMEGNWYGVGSGWGTHAAALSQRFADRLHGRDADQFPHAKDVLRLARRGLSLGQVLPPEDALPVYLRNRVTG
jgi:tRNA threonylcarbamoyladenosine biosynthesis protein TsaB